MINWAGIAVTGAAIGSLVAGTVSTLASIFARTVVTPEQRPSEDLKVLKFQPATETGGAAIITLPATKETTVDGRYTFVFNGGSGMARLGRILHEKTTATSVVREVEKVYLGDLAGAKRGVWSGFLWPHPAEAGFDSTEVLITVENGQAPAWLIEPGQSVEQTKDIWAIMVHGRGSKRTEGLRAVSTAQRLGMKSLLISFRNDGEAPATMDGRFGLGATEWRDVESAIKYAVDNGAENVVIFGYSMGGAVSLQLADLSKYSDKILGMVLDGPVIDWVDVLAHQAKVNRLPEASGRLGRVLLSSSWGKWITGLAAPLDLKAMDWVSRSQQLKVPLLIIHSHDDDFVPIGPSIALMKKRPDLVSLITFRQAQHTREWNLDPDRWENAATSWLRLLLARPQRRRALTFMREPAV